MVCRFIALLFTKDLLVGMKQIEQGLNVLYATAVNEFGTGHYFMHIQCEYQCSH